VQKVKELFKNTIKTALLFIFIVAANAQNINWNSIITVSPNPSPYIADWESDPRMLLYTVIYNGHGEQNTYTKAVLSGKRYGELGTVKGNNLLFPSGPLTKIFRNTDILNINESNLNKKFVTNVMKAGRLPEDDYTICISLYSEKGELLTEACADFSINLPDQPQLIYPADKDTINVANPSFQWTPVFSSTGKIIKYALRICEVMYRQTPLKAITANVPVYETILTGATIHLYPADGFPLETGKTYVWQIQALDEYGQPASVNQGKSEIWTFVRKNTSVISKPPIRKPVYAVKKISGKLIYDWPGSSAEAKPLKNVSVSLCVEYILKRAGLPVVLSKADLSYKFDDVGKVLATSQTDNTGNFDFSFNYADSTYMMAEDTTIRITDAGFVKGDIYKVLRLKVNSNYYASPSQNIMLNQDGTADAGTLTAKARRYQVFLKLWDPLNANDSMKYIVRVTRKGVRDDIPIDEGDSKRTENNPNSEYVIYDRNVEKDGSLVLPMLVQNKYAGDEYTVRVFSADNNHPANYSPFKLNFSGSQGNSFTLLGQGDKAVYADDYTVQYLEANINPATVYAQFKGVLKYKFYGQSCTFPLKNIQTKLVIKYILRKMGGGYVDVSDYVKDSDRNKVVSYAATDSSGNVVYNVGLQSFMVDSIGAYRKVKDFPAGGNKYSGHIYRALRVIVNSPYYCSPDEGNSYYGDIYFNEASHVQDFGTLCSLVRSYNLNITVKNEESNLPLNNIDVYLMRYKYPESIPSDEGGGYNGSQKQKTYGWMTADIIAKGTTSIVNGISGKITFTNLVKNDLSNPNDKYFLIYESNPQVIENYKTKWEPFSFDCNGITGVYNQDYGQPKIKNITKNLTPLPPYVTALFRRSDAANPAAGVTVYLTNVNGSSIQATSDSSGRVKISPLPENPNGPARKLYVFANSLGYRDTVLNVLNLSKGQKHDLGIIILKPKSAIKGNVIDDEGKPVAAYVGIDDGIKFQTNCGALSYDAAKKKAVCAKQSFEISAPSGSHKIKLEPKNKDKYFESDTTVFIPSSPKDFGNLVVYRKLHRLKFQVVQYVNGSPVPVKNAKVTIDNLDTNIVVPQKTNAQGQAFFIFNNDAKSFQIKIIGPADKDYEETRFTLIDSCSAKYRLINTYLKKAGRISGIVYVGKEPINRARVFLEVSGTNAVYNLQDFSKPNGTYTIRNVPFGTHTFYAVKGGTIGDSAKVNVSEDGLKIFTSGNNLNNSNISFAAFIPAETVDFHLKNYEDMDITKLLGIPIEITSFIPQPQGKIKINGRFTGLPTAQAFNTNENSAAVFNGVIVKAGTKLNDKGKPFIYPETGKIPLDTRKIKLEKILDVFSGALVNPDAGVLKLEDFQNSGDGIIKGKVGIWAGSFQTGNAVGFPTDSLWLNRTDITSGEKMLIPVICAGVSKAQNNINKFGISDFKGKSLVYSLHNFKNSAVADSVNSFAENGKLTLRTRLQTNIEEIVPKNLDIEIGDVVITPTGVSNINGNKEINISLENWSLYSNDWSFNSNGFFFHNGKITTDVLDLPFTKDLPVTPYSIETYKTEIDISSITLGGIVPLTVNGTVNFLYDATIGYQDSKGHWVLRVLPGNGETSCAYINAQKGMAQNDKIYFDAFYLLSDGSSVYSIDKKSQPLRLFNVADYYPAKIVVFNDRINIPGAINFRLPGFGELTTSIDYFKNGNNIDFSLTPVNIEFNYNGVNLKFPASAAFPQKLNENGFIARGTISEPDKYSFFATMYHTKDSSSIILEPNQSLAVNANQSIKLEKVSGAMKVNQNDWEYFWFEGDLTGAEGANGRLKFTVYGDVIATGQKIRLSNITTPFGNIEISFDFETKTLFGQLDFSEGIDIGGAMVKGTAEILFDDKGFYFLGAGTIGVAGIGGQAALILGSYPINDHIKSKFAEYSWVYKYTGNLPVTFPTNIKGFYSEAEVHIPLIIPDIEFDFFIVSARLWIHLGADARFGLNFTGQPKLSLGLSAYIEAGASLGASVVIACAGVKASAIVQASLDGEIDLGGNWFIQGDVSFQLCGEAYCGWGACDSDCDGYLCDKESKGGCKAIGLLVHVGSDYNDFDPYIK